ncbi:hypothetical protein RB653_007713 [Dictyostelium firmibasis]|uniref:FAD-binding FR-type domain-containing protein n=1 Tax=Dictyostelium firmibasis TaxID=79012 RepID=A0AAN7TP56_9MYCE
MTEPTVAAPKKKIVLKRAAGSSSSNELPSCKIKVEFIDNSCSKPETSSSLCVDQLATIESAKYMTIIDQESTIDIKRVIEMTLDLGNTELSYQPGDYISVFAPNTHNHVISLIKRLSLDENKLIKIESIDKSFELPNHLKKVNENFNNNKSTVYNVLKDLVDITGIPSKKLLKLLSEHSSDSNDKLELNKLSSIEGKEEYAQMINNRVTLLCLLEKFKSSNPPFSHLLELINPLAPRDYSISSSPLSMEKGRLSFVFSVVDFKLSSTPSQRILGHCTSWLEKVGIQNNKLSTPSNQSSLNLEESLSNLNIESNIQIPFLLKPSPHFHLPPTDQLNRPIIMIGPGTGVAPFIGFLQHLSKTSTTTTTTTPTTWLFFGCRSEKRDFLYKDTLESMLKDNTLTKLITAFSRELDIENSINNTIEPTCGYVQEKMIQHSKQLFDMVVNQNAFIYICGDAKGMAVGVRNSFIDIVKQELNCDEKQATDIFTNWIKEKRYILDVWS